MRTQWRAPEEYYDFPLNEKIDVFSYGNNLFTLLTGLMPFYNDARNVKEIQARVKAGTKPYIDPRWKARSFAERTIVELIEKCYEYDPDKRISIFEVVSILRQAYKENVEKYLHEDQKVRKRKEPDEEI